MKAFTHTHYGPPSVLTMTDLVTPKPAPDEILVRVHASSINSADLDHVRGTAFGRMAGLWGPRYKVIGSDIAGEITAVGKEVQGLAVGDRVYADLTEYGFGAFAQFIALPWKAVTLIPDHLTYTQAAALPSAAVIAMQGIQAKDLGPGSQVLINGAGGGMGTYALQLAKAAGATITAVDKGVKLDALLAMGADRFIDYNKTSYTKENHQYDLILDCQGFFSAFTYRRILKPGGVYRMIGGSIGSLINVFFVGGHLSRRSNKSIGLLLGRPNRKEDMDLLASLTQSGRMVPIIDRVFPFDQLTQAFTYYEQGTFVGKVVIDIVPQAPSE